MPSDFGNYFIMNTFLSKVDVEKNFHLLVIAWVIWNYFPFQKVKNYLTNSNYINQNNKNSVSFVIEEYRAEVTTRSDRYVALSNFLKNISTVKKSRGIGQTKRRANYVENLDCSHYEPDQETPFLIDREREIYGISRHEEVNTGNGNLHKTTLEIYSYKTSHRELTEMIEEINQDWKRSWREQVRKGELCIFNVSFDSGKGTVFKKYPFTTNCSFENTFFPGKEDLIKDLDNFINGEEEWKERGWPYQYGFSLTGKTGCGKTRILKCIAKYTGRHIYQVKINEHVTVMDLINVIHGKLGDLSLDPKEIIIVFEELSDQTELIENREIPPVPEIHGPAVAISFKEENEKKEEKIKTLEKIKNKRQFLSEFLPAIDGLHERDGGMIAITTNFPDRLDPAIMRPGRIDFQFHIDEGYDRETTYQLIKNHWKDIMDTYTSKDLKKEVCDKFTGAELIKKCRTESWDSFKKEFFDV
jgi:hypothetical protein